MKTKRQRQRITPPEKEEQIKQRQRITPPEKEEQIKQELAAKDLKARIKAAEREIRRLQSRYPEKSLLQLLRRIRLELTPFAEELAIARIERNQGGRLSHEDRMFVEEEKRLLRQNQPASKSCPCGS